MVCCLVRFPNWLESQLPEVVVGEPDYLLLTHLPKTWKYLSVWRPVRTGGEAVSPEARPFQITVIRSRCQRTPQQWIAINHENFIYFFLQGQQYVKVKLIEHCSISLMSNVLIRQFFALLYQLSNPPSYQSKTYLCICVFVFVFVYLYFCMCICVFVYLYLCISTLIFYQPTICHSSYQRKMCLCICVFVFLYVYLCICICLFPQFLTE